MKPTTLAFLAGVAVTLALMSLPSSCRAAVVVAPRVPSFTRPSIAPVRPPTPARPAVPVPARPAQPSHAEPPSNSWLSVYFTNLFSRRPPAVDCKREEAKRTKECQK